MPFPIAPDYTGITLFEKGKQLCARLGALSPARGGLTDIRFNIQTTKVF